MPDSRRVWQPGGTYFFTVNLNDRVNNDLLIRHIETLRDAVRDVRVKLPFEIVAWVVLPDHMHAIWTLPHGDVDYAKRWLAIKAIFSRRVPKTEFISNSRHARGERGIWQRRFWEHTIRDDRDLDDHINYVHYNPVKHGYVEDAAKWPYSSFHRYLRGGVLPMYGPTANDMDLD
jgi:putative transposase